MVVGGTEVTCSRCCCCFFAFGACARLVCFVVRSRVDAARLLLLLGMCVVSNNKSVNVAPIFPLPAGSLDQTAVTRAATAAAANPVFSLAVPIYLPDPLWLCCTTPFLLPVLCSLARGVALRIPFHVPPPLGSVFIKHYSTLTNTDTETTLRCAPRHGNRSAYRRAWL